MININNNSNNNNNNNNDNNIKNNNIDNNSNNKNSKNNSILCSSYLEVIAFFFQGLFVHIKTYSNFVIS